ncbi:MAG: glycoside hydrolase family 26 protein [Thermoleophilaceae bacterium]
MRALLINFVTTGATVVLLGTLTFPASRILTDSIATPVEKASAAPPRVAPKRLFSLRAGPVSRWFGVYVDPWHVSAWARAVGAKPQVAAKFTSFSDRRPVSKFLRECERRRIRSVLISWEPWRPVPAALGVDAQRRPQPGYRNADIAAGAQDAYIRGFARGLARFRGRVYLRYAHEMNGFWYPWSRDPRSYVRAWRRVVRIFRRAGASNVRFVWSVNPSLYLPRAQSRRNFSRYWPGSSYVDYVGSTMISFGGAKKYSVARFYPTLVALRQMYRKPLILTETNTAYRGRVAWLRDLRHALRRSPWIRGVAWSQLPSRAKVHAGGTLGDVDWDVTKDPASARVLRRIVTDGSG